MLLKTYTLLIAIATSILPSVALMGQNHEIRGTIIDGRTNEPVPFANVSIKNQAMGTTSNAMGVYKLTISAAENLTLVFSHINYHKKEIDISDATKAQNLNIELVPKAIQLSDVIVSAGLYEQQLNKVAQSVELIEHRKIVDNMYSNMTDLLASKPGFTQVWEYHSPIILRGLNSNRLIVMKDGNRRIGTFPGGYFAQNMNIYDTRKIEVVKGPGSVIYGNGAISGIINVISNEPFGDQGTSVQLHSGYGANNNEFIEMLKVCHKKEKFGISANAKYRKTGEMHYGNGDAAENSDVEDKDLAINTGVKLAKHHKIMINANYHWGDWGKPRGFNGPTKDFTKVRNEEENFHTDVSYSYSPQKFVESINLNLYYDNGWRDYYQYKYSTVSGNLSSLDLVHYKDRYGGGRLFGVFNLWQNNKFTTGIDGYAFRLNSPTDVFDYYNGLQGSTEGAQNAGQEDVGFFMNDEWTVSEQFKLIGGMRFDVATVLSGTLDTVSNIREQRTATSGNLGIVYSPNQNTHFSLNVGRAFRMPITEELFTKTISCQGVKIGNADLQPEYGWNIDAGFRGNSSNKKFKYDLALFHNKIDGFIKMASSNQPDIDFTFVNADARLMGGELSTSYQFSNVIVPTNVLFIGLGAAYVYGIDLGNKTHEPLFGIPPLKINGELNYKGKVNKLWITGYTIKVNAEHAAEQNRVAAIPEGTDGGPWGYVKSESQTTLNFSVGINSNALPGYPKLRIMVKNILNSDYQPFGSYIPAMGRNIKLLLSVHFKKKKK